jgi:hypothetical protein
MPPRLFCVAIVAFWLLCTAWLVQRDLWPRLAPGEPPLLPTVADEARRSRSRESWRAVRSAPGARDQQYLIQTWGGYHSDEETFEFRAVAMHRQRGDDPKLLRLERLTSVYRVNRDGSMKSFEVDVEIPAGLLGVVQKQKAHFHGIAAGKVCNLHWERGNDRDLRSGVEPFEVSRRGVVWLPLHPLYWLKGLRPGLAWGQPGFDPLGNAGLLSSTPAAEWVNARVRKQTEPLAWQGQEVACLVVDYDGDQLSGSTWVSAADDRVLRIEARLGDERWQITRESR